MVSPPTRRFLPRAGLASLSVAVLYLGLASNFWGVASQKEFDRFQKDTESWVIGRLIETRQNGPWSQGALLGWVLVDLDPRDYGYKWQYEAFRVGLSPHGYVPYRTHPGGQGFLLGLVDSSVSLPPERRLRFYADLTALLLAAALAGIVLWFEMTCGLTVASVILGSMVASHWLTVFGSNLYWSLWAFYVPLLVVFYWLHSQRHRPPHSFLAFGGLIFLAVLAKCWITGFEYITTAVLMIFVPVVFYAILDSWGWVRTFRVSLIVATAVILAVIAVAGILALQVGAVDGSVLDGIQHILFSLRKRTFGSPLGLPQEYAGSLRAPLLGVLLDYLKGRYIDFNLLVTTPNAFVARYLFKVRYLYVIVAFLLASGVLWFHAKRTAIGRLPRASLAMIGAAWFAILPPLSWFVLFKAHSAIHGHLNYIVWQMPFTFFGFGIIGLLLQTQVSRVRWISAALRAQRTRVDESPMSD